MNTRPIAGGILGSVLALATAAGAGIATLAVARAVLHRRASAWETRQRWGTDGVRDGCEDRSWGAGDVALLLVHGFGGSPAVWSRIAPTLAEQGFTCRALRLPGFGERPACSRRVRWRDWTGACASELAHLRANHRETWIVAHSLGATAALALASGPDAPDGLALLAPLLRVSRRRSPILGADTWFRAGRSLLRRVELLENFFPDDLLHAPPPGLPESDRFFPVALYAQLFALVGHVAPRAERISVPLLMIVSPRDRVADPAAAAAFFARAGSARKLLLRAERSAHLLPLDHDWRAIADAIGRFARGKGPGEEPPWGC